MGAEKQQFSCYIIGEESLVIQCAELILKNGHQLLGIVSSNEQIKDWANNKKIKYISSDTKFDTLLMKAEFDYLFSIVNHNILSKTLLKMPRQLAINYHDALLPKYAGVHATSWAILNNEQKHGITWHVMTDKLDAGDILKQRSVTVSSQETALSLNLKCYQAAINSFAELVDEIASHTYVRTPQDLTQRTYNAFNKKPIGNSLINWNDPAENIYRLHRALHFGPNYINHLSLPKFLIGKQVYIVEKITLTKKHSKEKPGTVLNITKKSLEISTKTNNISLSDIKTIDGRTISIKDLSKNHQLAKGNKLPLPTKNLLGKLGEFSEASFKNEAFWIKELEHFKPAAIPFLPAQYGTINYSSHTSVWKIKINNKLQRHLKKCYPNASIERILLTLWLIYLYRIGNQENSGIAVTYPELKQIISGLENFVTGQIPLITELNDKMNFADALSLVSKKYTQLEQHVTYLKDIELRHPKLTEHQFYPAINTIIQDNNKNKKHKFSSHIPINFIISHDGQLELFKAKQCSDKNLRAVLLNIPGHLNTLLEDIVQNQNQPISNLALLTPAEQQKILIDWNNTKTDYPRDKTVHQLFEEQVEKTPNNIAVAFEDKQLTYRELNEKANQLAHYLRKQGVKAETLVAICIERSLEMIIGILGIIKAGGAYVPIDPDYPQTRIDYILKDTKSPVIITQTNFAKYFNNPSLKVISIDNIKQELVKESKNNLSKLSQPENLIYVIYTSGSTGVPKGVQIIIKNLINCLLSFKKELGIQKVDSWLAITTLSFDIAGLELFLPLIIGAKIVIASTKATKDAQLLMHLLTQHNINFMQATPTTWRILIDSNWKGQTKLNAICGGEALNETLHASLLAKVARLWNVYGPTETTIWSTCSILDIQSLHLGKPIANTKIYILDNNLFPCPIGIPGELYIGGDGLARGYLNRTEMTNMRFIKFPSSIKAYARKEKDSIIYKTGDLVRWLPNGNIEYIDRIDNQVKIRGFRTELNEIESTLCKHPMIARAVVLAQSIENDSKRLVGYIIEKANPSKHHKSLINKENIQAFLENFLPRYSIPNVYYKIKDLPLSSSGKIDRHKLVKLQENPLPSNNKKIILPRNEIESLLTNIWKKVLKFKDISIHDNFFALGGDSILAIQITSKARQAGWDLSIHQIFSYPTIAEIASKISKINSITRSSINTSITIPLSPIQQWFFNQPLVSKEQFSHICLLNIDLPINIKKLEKCLKMVITKNEALNLLFTQINTGWQQYISNQTTIKHKILHVAKVMGQTSENLKQLIEQWTYKLQYGFNLTDGPLFQAVLLICKTSSQAKLLIAAHHLIIDGVSWRILLEDLEKFYYKKNLSNSQKIIRSDTFKDWVELINIYAQKHKFLSERYYWKKISNISYKIPLDFELGSNLEKYTNTIQTTLDVEETYLLFKQAPKIYNIRFHKLLIAVLIKTLANWTKSKTILLNLKTHGREELFNQVDITNTIGWFTNLFPAFINLKKLNLADYLQDIDTQLNKIASKSLTYGILRYLKKEGYQLNINAPISFNYCGQFNKSSSDTSQFKFNWLRSVSAPENLRTHLIDIEAVINNGQLSINWTYSQNFHLQSTIARLANGLVDNLKSLLFNCKNSKISNLLLTGFPRINLTSEQLKRLVEENEDANIERIYPLTPMQQGLLSLSLYSTCTEVYSVQLTWTLHNINLVLLQNAFQLLINRHAILRTHIKWEGLAEPIQIVQKQAELLWREYDWHELPVESQQQRLNFFLKSDRQTGFNFDKAPLLRVSIIKNNNCSFQIILTLHHILIDGWSLSSLLNDFGKIYQALAHQKNVNLPDPPNFALYIEWLQKQDFIKAKNFWKRYLKDFSGPTDLVITDRKVNSSAKTSMECNSKIVTLSRSLTQQIHYFCKQYKLTLSTFFQGLWALLLNRYSQSEDIVFGITVSGRTPEIPAAENMIGLMINTLPLRIQFNQDLTVTDYLIHIQKNFSELMNYAYASLSDIQLWSEVQSHSTLFESILVIENYPIEKIPGLNINFHNIEIIDPTHYPITLSVILNKQMSLKFNYDCNAIQHDALERLIGHVKTLLAEILSNPDESIHKLNILTEVEKQKILYEWNQTETDYPRNKSVHQLFEEQAEMTPNNIAIVFEGKQLTYKELNEKANQFANYLRKQNIDTGIIVAICLERNLETIISILGILKAGGIYVPIDPEHPLERQHYILKDTKSSFIITAVKFKCFFEMLSLRLIEIDNIYDELEIESKVNLSIYNNQNNLLYIIYTSGSTGKPKGVAIRHFSVTRLVKNTNYISIQKEDKIAQLSNLSFDAATFEIWGALLNGATLFIITKNIILDIYALANEIKTKNITIVLFITSLFNQITNLLPNVIDNLKYLLFGGEQANFNHIKNILNRKKNYLTEYPTIINLYGPTENTVISTYYKIEFDQASKIIPIGKPISNSKAYVLDKYKQLLPTGVIGELYLGGDGLADCYFNNNLLTDEKFILFSHKKFKSNLFKTGDLARWLPDGNLEYIGRLDNQVKIRGYRIELGEIQTQIEKYPGVKQAVVICHEKIKDEKYLIAYVLCDDKTNLNIKDLQDFLKIFLPIYMIPSAYIKVDKFPLTHNLKIDKNLLIKMEKCQMLTTPYITPHSNEEKILVKIWSKILGIRKIGVEDNFFELGGHSLTALKVISLIRNHFKVDLPISMLYQNPTIKMLAKKIILLREEMQLLKTSFNDKLDNSLVYCLIPLKIRSNKTPLFLIHPIGGTIFWYITLIKYLDPVQSVYAIQDPEIELESYSLQCIEEMANLYIKMIKSIQPCGPYLIAGASSGSTICIEMAKQFKRSNEEVAFLAFFDGWAPFPEEFHHKEIFEANMRRQYNKARDKFQIMGINSAENLLSLQWKRSQQNANYQVPIITQQITLFKAAEIIPIYKSLNAPFNHWENHSTQPIELYITPGNHETMFEEPNVQVLAQRLNECLHRVHKNINLQSYNSETRKAKSKTETLLAI